MSPTKTILITGASGYIGKALLPKLKQAGYAIRTLTTQSVHPDSKDTFFWNPVAGILDEKAVQGVDYIIHLAGASIGTYRWTDSRKRLIMDSRIKSTTLLYEKVVRQNIPLKAFISASATGYYGSSPTDKIMDENSPAGDDFLADVCREWERAADLFSLAGIRTVKIRTGVVLGKDAPALQKMLLPVKMGIAGPLGSGKQFMPWIGLDDLCDIYLKTVEDKSFAGVYNAVVPQQITNKELMKTLAKVLHKPFFMPAVPAFMLRLLLGEMAVIVTQGRAVYPKRLISAGFEFRNTEVSALMNQFVNCDEPY